MIRVLHSILIILFVFMSMITKSISSDISTILRNQQLTVFDIGVFRLQEDLKSTYPEINATGNLKNDINLLLNFQKIFINENR